MANVINYIFNISGNFASNIGIMVNQTEQLSKSVKEASGFLYELGQKAMGFAAIADVAQNMNDAFNGIIEAGAPATFALILLQQFYSLIFSPYRKRTNIFWETITMIILCFIHLTVLILRDFHDLIFSLSS